NLIMRLYLILFMILSILALTAFGVPNSRERESGERRRDSRETHERRRSDERRSSDERRRDRSD
uniref:Uncharacterized protein n=1 Tax=Acrobeloides nanus TaxID=290746 RepID=A0A914D7P6_9BILA